MCPYLVGVLSTVRLCTVPLPSTLDMNFPKFNQFDTIFRRQKGKERHDAANAHSSNEPNSGRDSVELATGDQAAIKSPLSDHVDAPTIHQDDHNAAAIHAILDSLPSDNRTSDVQGVLLDITSISAATDLRDPLKLMSDALRKALETAKVSTYTLRLALVDGENCPEYEFIERGLE